jgi:maltose alpha-D-glucosyltransferase / alpha-amylase
MLRCGDEIGMAENLDLPERLAVRTPMQWSSERNGGFSSADPHKLIRPVNEGGPAGYRKVNVAAQEDDPDSILSRVRRLVHVRNECPELAKGKLFQLDADSAQVFAHRCELDDGAIVAMHNLSSRAASCRKAPWNSQQKYRQLIADPESGPLPTGGESIELAPYGYRWVRISPAASGSD